MNYSASVSGDSSNTTTTDACQREECSFSYSIPSSFTLTDSSVSITVTPFNAVGGGPESSCSSMNISKYSVYLV